MARNFLGILLILAAIGAAIFWTNPLWISLGEMREEKAALESAVKRFQELKKVRDDILTAYNAISPADLARLEELLPKSEHIGTLLVNVEKLSGDSGVSLKQIDIQSSTREESAYTPPREAGEGPGGAPSPVRGYTTLPLSFSVNGSYNAFRSFLGAVEKNLRLIDVETISFNASEKGNYDFSLTAAAYWYKGQP